MDIEREIEAEELLRRVDPAIAAERALLPAHRVTFARKLAGVRLAGMTPADYIDGALDVDAHLDVIEPWWEAHPEAAVALADYAGLPVASARRLLAGVLVAGAVLGVLDDGRYDEVLRMARRAAAYARGYADALGYLPTEPGVGD